MLVSGAYFSGFSETLALNIRISYRPLGAARLDAASLTLTDQFRLIGGGQLKIGKTLRNWSMINRLKNTLLTGIVTGN
jgi:hypothetical protein